MTKDEMYSTRFRQKKNEKKYKFEIFIGIKVRHHGTTRKQTSLERPNFIS